MNKKAYSSPLIGLRASWQAKKVPNRGQNHPVFERLTKPGSFGNKGGNTIF